MSTEKKKGPGRRNDQGQSTEENSAPPGFAHHYNRSKRHVEAVTPGAVRR